jgi:ABC-type nitrate/sulfonate/bicarbonate transport system substrate-binding protein
MDLRTDAELRVCSFQGLQNLPIYVAMREGYFSEQGLSVSLTYTAGSAPQLGGLARGEYDLILTAPDNIINFDTDPAAFGLVAATAPRVAMVLGGSNGPLSIYPRPGVTSAEELRGGALGVDNPTSGFAIVLRDMLMRHGLALDRDYAFVVAGGTHARGQALLEGSIAATILYAPFDLRAAEGGCVRLATSTEQYGAYASLAAAGTQAWVEAHADVVTRYIAAILRALRWIHDPARGEAAQELMRTEPALGVDGVLARQAYSAFIAPDSGFGAAAALDDAGLRQVIALRAAYGRVAGPLGQPADYCDRRWYEQARGWLAFD